MAEDLGIIFGKVLKMIRVENKVSQDALADLCELDRTYISLLERGLRQPTITTLFKLAEALKISPVVIISRVLEESQVK